MAGTQEASSPIIWGILNSGVSVQTTNSRRFITKISTLYQDCTIKEIQGIRNTSLLLLSMKGGRKELGKRKEGGKLNNLNITHQKKTKTKKTHQNSMS